MNNYYIDDIYAPHDLDEDQNYWVGIISRGTPGSLDYFYGCVEIREGEEETLLRRLNELVVSLNGYTTLTETKHDNFDKAMEGI